MEAFDCNLHTLQSGIVHFCRLQVHNADGIPSQASSSCLFITQDAAQTTFETWINHYPTVIDTIEPGDNDHDSIVIALEHLFFFGEGSPHIVATYMSLALQEIYRGF